jgi:hypothetical protein
MPQNSLGAVSEDSENTADLLLNSSADANTRAKWAKMWNEDDSVNGLFLAGGVNHVMCMGITDYGKLVGVLQVINREHTTGDDADSFSYDDRCGLETLCGQISGIVARACANANFAHAMENNMQLAEYSNDRSATKMRRQTLLRTFSKTIGQIIAPAVEVCTLISVITAWYCVALFGLL